MISIAALNPNKHILTQLQMKNLVNLCRALFEMQEAYNGELFVNSGFRSAQDQERIDPSHPGSAHCEGLAADLKDEDGLLWAWCTSNLDSIATWKLYLEDGSATPGWVHVQMKAPKSGKRVFTP